MSHFIEYEEWTFDRDKIDSGNLYLATSLLSSSQEVNSFVVIVKCDDPSILDFQRNSKLLYYTVPERPMVFRVQNIRRTGPNLYEISTTSTLGLLTEGQHMGGIYTGQTVQDVVASICGTVPFAVKHNLDEINLYGWLPIASPRDNLAQVLFAIGAALKTDLDGVLRIEGLWDGISGAVIRDDMYADATVDYEGKITQVIVIEHQYVPWTKEEQLFEGTAQEGDIITFDEPMHSLTADGFTILDSGANWAKVSTGSGVLSGRTYIHNTRQISKDVWPAREPNIKTVKDATLVSLVNSQACAQRLADYYRCRERVDASVVYRGEMPGDRLSTYHPFDKIGVAACLESADITLSNTLKAKEKSLVGFVPQQIEQAVIYDNREFLTSSGTWTVPEGVTNVRVVLIGGGQKGEDGNAGISNMVTSKSYTGNSFSTPSANGMPGGEAGLGGSGGKVFEAIIDVIPGQKINVVIGGPGKNSLFGGLSSESGGTMPTGWTDIITGETFAKPGEPGIKGGKGGDPGEYGESVNGNQGGMPLPGSALSVVSSSTTYANFSWNGSGGGGASAMSAAQLGMYFVASISGQGTTQNFVGGAYISDKGGSQGADGGKREGATGYGNGGPGGHGGGGAGGFSSVSVVAKSGTTLKTSGFTGAFVTGGKGGEGGNGAPGCIILYYGVEKKLVSGQLVDKNNRMVLDRLGRRIIM